MRGGSGCLLECRIEINLVYKNTCAGTARAGTANWLESTATKINTENTVLQFKEPPGLRVWPVEPGNHGP